MNNNAVAVNDNSSLLPAFDGLRGLLALWVFASHVIVLTDGPHGFLTKGGIAVDLFMMISGFLMYWNVRMRATKEPPNKFGTWLLFYIRRFFRIAPLYYVSLVPAYLFSDYWLSMHKEIYAAHGVELFRPFLDCRPDFIIDIALHISFLYGLFPCAASSNVLPDWSLSLEMQFYLVFPLLYFICKDYLRIVLTLGAAIIVGWSASQIFVFGLGPEGSLSYPQPSILILRLNCFVVGMLLAGLCIKREFDWFGILCFLFAAFVFQRLTFSFLAIAIGFFLMDKDLMPIRFRLLSGLVFGVFQKVLGSGQMRWLGDISYGLYLLHLFVLIPTVSWLYSIGAIADFYPWQRSLFVGILTLPLVLFLAWFGHLTVEKKGIALGRSFSIYLMNRWRGKAIVI